MQNLVLFEIQDSLNDTTTNASLNAEFDVIDAQLAALKDNFGISFSFLSGSLSITQSLTVVFPDGTKMEYQITLDKDVTADKPRIKIELKFKVARDKDGKVIPLNSYEAGKYGNGNLITPENTGNLIAFVTYMASLSNVRVQYLDRIVNPNTGTTEIKDCEIVKEGEQVRVVCER